VVLTRGFEALAYASVEESAGAEAAPPEELAERLLECLRTACEGLLVVSADCGLGKSEAAKKIAIERAATVPPSKRAKGTRPPLHSKTAISVDKNSLALQYFDDLKRQGVSVKRVFGPAGLLNADGTPVCRYHQAAVEYLIGGQSMRYDFCDGRGIDPCEQKETCAARLGFEGDPNARICIGPHPLLKQLEEHARPSGLLFIDEPPSLIETEPLTAA
jgi:hypothetical protein